MIRETLTAIGQAGRQALLHVASKAEVETQVTQVREWSFAMPSLALVTVANSPIHQIYVGMSRPLANFFSQHDGVYEILLDQFKKELVMRVPAKRPIGEWKLLPADGETRVLRGVRSFILRQQTAAGNLYLLADVASRCEFETMRQPDWESELADRLLPSDLSRNDVIESPAAIERLGTYLARCEHDLEILVPGNDGVVHSCNAVLMSRTKTDSESQLVVSIDLGKEERQNLEPGVEIEGSFGAAGRVFRFRTACAGSEGLKIDGGVELPCYRFSMPERFNLDQRRRYFRVQPSDKLIARIEVLPPEAAADAGADPLGGHMLRLCEPPADATVATVDDLSFSGVGLTIDGPAAEDLCTDGLVHIWLDGEGIKEKIELTGLVRRLDRTPLGRGRMRTEVGLEFVVRGPIDRQSTQVVRQYVMSQQRRLLSSRSSEGQPA